MDKVWVIIPAYNEGTVIGEVVAPILAEGWEVVVIDDASTDGTAELLADSGVHLCRHAVNLGQGAALQTGITFALRQGAEYLVTFDADGQHRFADIPRMLEKLKGGDFDIVLGSRFLDGGGAENIPKSRRLLLQAATQYTRVWCGLDVTDTHNGFRAMTADAARKIQITESRMAHATEILREIRRHRLRYTEQSVTIDYTAYSLEKGQSTSNALVVLFDSFRELMKL